MCLLGVEANEKGCASLSLITFKVAITNFRLAGCIALGSETQSMFGSENERGRTIWISFLRRWYDFNGDLSEPLHLVFPRPNLRACNLLQSFLVLLKTRLT